MSNAAMRERIYGWVVLAGVVLMGGSGCQHVVNCYKDETISAEAITTPTAEGIRHQAMTGDAPVRHWREDWSELVATSHRGTVSHWPLWFEDEFEDRGSNDGRFAWTWEDYAAFPYSIARWDLNVLALSVSAVVTPPFTIMSSDGIPSWQYLGAMHDAEVGPGSAIDVGAAESVVVQSEEEPEEAAFEDVPASE